jgi:DNA helicase II / ATP-dependent DNA helicase PcrA
VQNTWDYILVDEFQDTNSLQVEIIRMMSAMHKNLFIIGDWKQSIYEWRGGNYEILKNIEKYFPSVRVSSLTKTYRNCKKILEVANYVSCNILGDQPIETAKTEDGSVSALQFGTREEEAVWIIEHLKEIHEAGKTAFVLSRTNAYLTSIELFLLYEKIPYYISAQSVLTSELSLDILCMLFVITSNSKPEENVRKRLLKFSCPYVSKKDKEIYLSTGSYDTLDEHVRSKFDKLKNTLSDIRNYYFDRIDEGNLNLSEFAKLAFQELHYTEYMETLYTKKELEDALEIAENYLNTLHIFGSLEELFSIVLSKNKTNSTSEKIKLLTIHASKGLEAKNVFVAGMTQGVFPSSKSYVSEEHLEAEKRLLYVAVTRAEENLKLSCYGIPSEYFNTLSEVCRKINLTK